MADSELTDRVVTTTPKAKPTYQDAWNAAYRGLVPGGLNSSATSGAPVITDVGPDPLPFDETDDEEDVVPADAEPPPITKPPVPVVLIDDLTVTRGNTEQYFRAYQIQVGAIESVVIAARDSSRTRLRIINMGPGDVFIGDTESVADGGYLLPTSELSTFDLNTTRQVWAHQETEQVSTAILSVIVEYTKER